VSMSQISKDTQFIGRNYGNKGMMMLLEHL